MLTPFISNQGCLVMIPLSPKSETLQTHFNCLFLNRLGHFNCYNPKELFSSKAASSSTTLYPTYL